MSDEQAPDRGKPDAVIYPVGWVAGTPRDRAKSIQDRLGPILGGKVWSSDISETAKIARLDPTHTLLHPQDHPTLARTHRYDWVEQPDGLKYGYLKDEAKDTA